tara:strand:- start:131597 stop:131980 length:384 start_codon:yes stop_codon:yes gene_type:complete
MRYSKKFVLYNAIFVLIFCIFVIVGVNLSHAQDNSRFKLLESSMNANTQSTQSTNKCQTLTSQIQNNISKVIREGQIYSQQDETVQNIRTSSSAMALNKCDKSKLYEFLNKKIDMSNPLYFEIYALL